jgi:hypothetical protein
MLVITVLQINIHFSRIYTTQELTDIAKVLRDFAFNYTNDFHPEIASSIDICVEDGCTKIKVIIKKAITLIVLYGGICQGAEYVWKHCKGLTTVFSNQMIDNLALQKKEILFKRTGSSDLFKLYRLMQKVRSGEITEDRAALDAARILERDLTVNEINEFQQVVASAYTSQRASHQNLPVAPLLTTIASVPISQDSGSPLIPRNTKQQANDDFQALIGRRGIRIIVTPEGKEELVEL